MTPVCHIAATPLTVIKTSATSAALNYKKIWKLFFRRITWMFLLVNRPLWYLKMQNLVNIFYITIIFEKIQCISADTTPLTRFPSCGSFKTRNYLNFEEIWLNFKNKDEPLFFWVHFCALDDLPNFNWKWRVLSW